jgi:hypothetical protein
MAPPGPAKTPPTFVGTTSTHAEPQNVSEANPVPAETTPAETPAPTHPVVPSGAAKGLPASVGTTLTYADSEPQSLSNSVPEMTTPAKTSAPSRLVAPSGPAETPTSVGTTSTHAEPQNVSKTIPVSTGPTRAETMHPFPLSPMTLGQKPAFAGTLAAPIVPLLASRDVSSAVLWLGGLAAGTTLHDLRMILDQQAVTHKFSPGLRRGALVPSHTGLAYALEFNSEVEASTMRDLCHGLVVGEAIWIAYIVEPSYMDTLACVHFSSPSNDSSHRVVDSESSQPRPLKRSHSPSGFCAQRRRHYHDQPPPIPSQSSSTRDANAKRRMAAKASKKGGSCAKPIS